MNTIGNSVLFFKKIIKKRDEILLPWFKKYWPETNLLGANALCYYRILISFYIISLLLTYPFPQFKNQIFFWFIIGSLLDFFDGLIARAKNSYSSWGAFLDRLADKFLVCPILFLFLWNLPAKFTAICLVVLELSSVVIALTAKQKGVNISSNWAGKWKMTAQVVLVMMIFTVPTDYWQKYKLICWVWLTIGIAIGSFIGHLQNYIKGG